MNMILHDFPTANIALGGNTLVDPKFKDGEQLRTYDYVVANPPFSDKTWSHRPRLGEAAAATATSASPGACRRRSRATTPTCCTSSARMKSTGKGACILPHGVLFRGNAEAANLRPKGSFVPPIGALSGVRSFSPDIRRQLVLPEAGVNRVPQEAIGRPGQIGDLGDNLRLDPVHSRKDERRSEAG